MNLAKIKCIDLKKTKKNAAKILGFITLNENKMRNKIHNISKTKIK